MPTPLPPTVRAGPMPPGLDAALDAIRQQFAGIARENDMLRGQVDDYEGKVQGQVNELNIVRRSLLDLEAQHGRVRQQYDDELGRLRAQLRHLEIRDRERERDERDRERERGERMGERERAERMAEREERMDVDPRDRPREERSLNRWLPDPMPGRGRPSDGPPHDDAIRGRPLDREERRPPPPVTPGKDELRLAPIASPNMPIKPESPERAPRADVMALSPHEVPVEFCKDGSDWSVVWNPKTKRALDISLEHAFIHTSVVCCVRFSSDGRFLATGCNRTAQIFDVRTGAKNFVFPHGNAKEEGDLFIRAVYFSPDGKYLATGAEDMHIRIWEISTQRPLHVLTGHTAGIYALAYSLDGHMLVSGSGDGTARIWEIPPVTPSAAAGATPSPRCLKVLPVNPRSTPETQDIGVLSVALSPDGRRVATGSLDSAVHIWDAASGECVERVRGHEDSVYSVVFEQGPRGGMVTGSLDGTMRRWDPRGRGYECVMVCEGHKDYVLSVGVSGDEKWVVSGSKDRAVRFWDARTGAVQLALRGHKNSVISIDLAASGGLLASGSGDCQARIWRYSSV